MTKLLDLYVEDFANASIWEEILEQLGLDPDTTAIEMKVVVVEES